MQIHSPRIVVATRALREQMRADGALSAIESQVAGPDPSQPLFEADDPWIEESDEQFWDNISGEILPSDMVRKARAVEIGWVHDIKLYDKVPRAQAVSRGIKTDHGEMG